jgi:preprotein translocase subunit Sec63
LETAGMSRPRQQPPHLAKRPEPDRLDHEALRSRIAARRALVDEGDYFALLGVSRNATSYDVRRAYTELREELDPTRVLTPATADLRDDVDAILFVIDEAYEILADDLRRERYRRALEAAPN